MTVVKARGGSKGEDAVDETVVAVGCLYPRPRRLRPRRMQFASMTARMRLGLWLIEGGRVVVAFDVIMSSFRS